MVLLDHASIKVNITWRRKSIQHVGPFFKDK